MQDPTIWMLGYHLILTHNITTLKLYNLSSMSLKIMNFNYLKKWKQKIMCKMETKFKKKGAAIFLNFKMKKRIYRTHQREKEAKKNYSAVMITNGPTVDRLCSTKRQKQRSKEWEGKFQINTNYIISFLSH